MPGVALPISSYAADAIIGVFFMVSGPDTDQPPFAGVVAPVFGTVKEDEGTPK